MIFERSISNLALFGAGLEFLRLRGADLKYFQHIYPFAATILLVWLTYSPSSATVYFTIDARSASESLANISANLVGFYLAALAAVVAFDGKSLDTKIAGEGVFRKSNNREIPVTRRQLLAALFGYCIMLCLAFLIVPPLTAILFNFFSVEEVNKALVSNLLGPIIFFWGLCSLVSVSLLGLYYLVMHFER